ncbi:hypothetical protein AACH06_25445 [Ideonella sp. DXS29W]|uniref:HEPN domain-containing protein n=1 Tax=Ideonella lacteola TaxID=2984193 RepID=A0ABU9BZA9_9BURK
MTYDEALAVARRDAHALAERLLGQQLKSDRRSRVALSCFAIAQQHHSSIIVLLSHPSPLQASAFALLRPLAEAIFRGLWVAHCASEEKAENLHTGAKKQIDMATIVRELIEAGGKAGDHPDFYRRVWPHLSAFTHSYEASLDPWLQGQDVEANFEDGDLMSLLKRTHLMCQCIEAGVLSMRADPSET